MTTRSSRAAVGFTVKSGWASVVLVGGSPSSPTLVDSQRIELSDPAEPDARQPYHAGFGTARDKSRELTALVTGVRRFGRQSVHTVLKRYQSGGTALCGAGIVVGSLIDPDTIANDHIRIHALEGKLFREVVEQAASRSGLSCTIWRERDLLTAAAGVLKRPEPALRTLVAGLGGAHDGPWRVEQKAAALAAWLVLAG